jgi:hypothetical protein
MHREKVDAAYCEPGTYAPLSSEQRHPGRMATSIKWQDITVVVFVNKLPGLGLSIPDSPILNL